MSKCAVQDSQKSIFTKKQEASGLLIKLEIKDPFSNIIILDGIFSYRYNSEWGSKKVFIALTKKSFLKCI